MDIAINTAGGLSHAGSMVTMPFMVLAVMSGQAITAGQENIGPGGDSSISERSCGCGMIGGRQQSCSYSRPVLAASAFVPATVSISGERGG